ncbi:MAG TPA: acyl-CoA synthetase [Candidatus Latescibacteria bacterium]|nr:acyl-CoA synthetase [Gemmatimonadota bacterium]HCR17772.1 acyl-CoA synthetase [Candidatus Latescibacterota bacterium]
MRDLILGNILVKNANDPGLAQKIALISGDTRWTYAELNLHSNRIGNGLIRKGVSKGDRIAVLGRNSLTYVALYFALAKIGAIMVPVNFWYRESEIRYTLEQSSCSGLIHDTGFAAILGEIEADVASLEWRLSYSRLDEPSPLGELAESSSDLEPRVDLDESDPHIILYTSGTTGFPKGTTVSHRSHFLHAISLALSTHAQSDDVGVLVYPLFHTGGPDCLLLPHFVMGATLVVMDGGDPDPILLAAETHEVTNIFCVPTVWRWLLDHQRKARYDISTVRRCLGSSDTFPPDLLDNILTTFQADVYVTYGLTEAGCILTVCRHTKDDRGKLGSVGRPMSTVELKLVDEEDAPVERGEVGEILAQSPSLMLKYWNMPEKTEEAFVAGWLRSGDLGRLDEEGFLFLSGRAKDMIISGGENIYPLEIERLLKEHPAILDAAVVGIPNREWGEAVLAAVVLSPGESISEQEAISYVSGRVAGYKRPKFVEFLDKLPVTTATGKIQKGVLRETLGKKYGT